MNLQEQNRALRPRELNTLRARDNRLSAILWAVR